MPIRPENRARYPKDWSTIRASILDRAQHRCEQCGVPNYALGGRGAGGIWRRAQPTGTDGMGTTWPKPGEHAWCDGNEGPLRIVKIVLTIAHLDHQPENNDPANLQALCQRCHLSYDAKHHAANTAITRNEKRGQLDLLGRDRAKPVVA